MPGAHIRAQAGLAQLHSGAPSLSWRCLLLDTFHGPLMSLLGTCATPAAPLCLITWACVDEESLGKERRIVQSYLAKTSQETKSSRKVVPFLLLDQEARDSNKMAFN